MLPSSYMNTWKQAPKSTLQGRQLQKHPALGPRRNHSLFLHNPPLNNLIKPEIPNQIHQQKLHLRLRESPANTVPGPLQERHVRVIIEGLGKFIPAVGVEDVDVGAPEGLVKVYCGDRDED